mmetsp:Transcript_32887/g.65120  ORF Transcript_32887/g.65120 Transcript_32887/m.65120 type:complete len:140 (+) Transcript_32887:218-637(+)
MDLRSAFSFVFVGFLWGATTPMMKDQSLRAEHSKKGGRNLVADVISDLANLLAQWRFLVPFLVNQLGSLAFYILLGSHSMAITVPAVNALSFLFTFLAELVVFAQVPGLKSCVGTGCILLGTYLCMLSGSVHVQEETSA